MLQSLPFAKLRVSKICKEGTLLKKRKRKGRVLEKLNRKKRKTKTMQITKADGRAIDEADRISELPEHILHHILSLLRWPKDIARTSLLSKKWKVIWESFTSFDFDQRHFVDKNATNIWSHLQPPPVENQSLIFRPVFQFLVAGKKSPVLQKFVLFVENAFATRLNLLPSIEKFRLCITREPGLAPLVDHWISVATDKNVKELEIHSMGDRHYQLPQDLFASRTITTLKLHGCVVDASAEIRLQNLRQLSMKAMRINENVVHNFVQGCPLIEDMRLINCYGMKFLHISNPAKLNRLEVHGGSSLRWVKLEAPNLETFWFYAKKSSRCKLIVEGCENLRSLTLRHAHMSDKSFQEWISYFPLLEKLFLLECQTLKSITILSGKLKKLALIRCHKLKEANIDAPNLLSFQFTGTKLPFSSMNASQLQEVKLHLKSQKHQYYHHCAVHQFIQEFVDRGFKLFLASKQDVSIHEDFNSADPMPYQSNKIELTKSEKALRNLLNSHLRDFHPESIMLNTSTGSDLSVSIKEMLMNREETPRCCGYYTRRCWMHYLVDVSWSELSKPSSPGKPTEIYKLKWSPWPSPPEDVDYSTVSSEEDSGLSEYQWL